MEFASCTRLARDGSHHFHGVKSFSFFLAIFLQGSKWSEERKREEKSVTYLLTCRQYKTRPTHTMYGIGKTTYCKKYAYDWATKKQAPQGCGFTAFKAVLLLKCREMHSDVWEAIDEQLLPRVWRIQTTISFNWYWMDWMSHHPVNCRFFRINWRKSTSQMPHSCNSKTRNWKRGEKMLWRAASDRRIHSNSAYKRICHQVL